MRVLVVGSGLAGLLTAITAADAGHEVALVTKAGLGDGSTGLAQGGVAAAVFPGDSVAMHVFDTLAAGAGLADPEAVRVLCAEGPARVRELIRLGVAFDRDESGIARGLEAAHSRARILHAGGDATGAAIERALIHALDTRSAIVSADSMLLDLVVEDGIVRGARFLEADGRFVERRAEATVLATGGWGVLYGRTTNPEVSTGDGVAAAWRAGAAVADLEFTQFHPTALAVPGSPLVSEAVRGEGAVLLDASGRRFMPAIDARAELAPRDVVARAVHATMAAQGGEPVRLDATALGRAHLARRFPGIDARTRAAGYDWSCEPVPITPAAHYAMGGIATDDRGRTSLAGLLAVGETARTGVHGANRLASNSLLEAAVFAHRAVEGLSAAHTAPGEARTTAGRAAPGEARTTAGRAAPGEARTTAGRAAPGEARRESRPAAPFTRPALQQLMWEHVGIVRDEAGLRRAAARLEDWADEASTASIPRVRAAAEDRNLLDLAALVTAAALARRESVGAHFRRDGSESATEEAAA